MLGKLFKATFQIAVELPVAVAKDFTMILDYLGVEIKDIEAQRVVQKKKR